MARLLSAATVLLLLSACGSSPVSSPDFPEAQWSGANSADPVYLLAPGDTVEINVLFAPELSRTVTVAPDGRVRIPYSGPIVAIGRTVDEVRLDFMEALSSELKNSDVEIIATEYASQQIFVGGEVREPGVFELPGQIGALQAIVTAGGFTDEARRKEVVLMRRIPGGEIRSAVVNINAGIFDPVLAAWGPLQRFDIVYVPKSRIAQENLFVQQWIRNALPIEFSIFYDLRGN